MRKTIVLVLLVSTGGLAAGPPAASKTPEDSVLLRGGTIHPVSGPEIPNGSVLVKGGKIVEVGKSVAASGVRALDIKGLHVYPGLIDSATELGLSEIGSVRESNDTSEIGDFNPQVRAVIAVNPASEHIPVTRANGTTAAVALPQGGLLAGQAALMHLDGWTWEDMALLPSAAMVMQFPAIQPSGRRGGGYGGFFGSPTSFTEAKRTYDRRIQQLHEFFEEARRYQRAKAAKAPGFEPDLKFEAMLPVLEGKQPLITRVTRERAIRDAVKFAEAEKVKLILADADDAVKLAADLKAKSIPIILGPTLALPAEEDDPYDRSLTLPAELHKAGLKFAFGSFGNQFARNLPYQVANAVAYGLPYEEGLKAVTLNAAQIWGVADKLGSIEKGKLADLIVTDGDPLETRTQIKYEFIRGRQVDLGNKHTKLYEKYVNRP